MSTKYDKLPDGEKAGRVLALWGWKCGPCECGDARCDRGYRWKSPEGIFHDEPPDVLNDLNAMHEAEEKLTPDQWVLFGRFIEKTGAWPYIHATAAQRAEAFVESMEA